MGEKTKINKTKKRLFFKVFLFSLSLLLCFQVSFAFDFQNKISQFSEKIYTQGAEAVNNFQGKISQFSENLYYQTAGAIDTLKDYFGWLKEKITSPFKGIFKKEKEVPAPQITPPTPPPLPPKVEKPETEIEKEIPPEIEKPKTPSLPKETPKTPPQTILPQEPKNSSLFEKLTLRISSLEEKMSELKEKIFSLEKEPKLKIEIPSLPSSLVLQVDEKTKERVNILERNLEKFQFATQRSFENLPTYFSLPSQPSFVSLFLKTQPFANYAIRVINDNFEPLLFLSKEGRLGIGTESPREKLEVSGNILGRGNLIVLGKVGVGTTTPAFSLDVNGNLRTTGDLRVEGNFTVLGAQTFSGSALFEASSTTPALTVIQNGNGDIAIFKKGTEDVFKIDNSGNIWGTKNLTIQGETSLATTTISTQLAVPKIITSSGNLTIDPAGNLMISKSTSISGNLTVSGIATTTQLVVTSTSTLGTVISGIWQGSVISTKYGGTGNDWSNVATGSLPYFSNTGTLSTLPIGAQNTVLISSGTLPQWSSSLNLAGTLAVSGTSTLATTTLSRLTITELTPGSVLFVGAGGLVSQDNSNLFWDNTNKRLGIRTSNPAYTLTVNGDLYVSATSTLGSTTSTPVIFGGYVQSNIIPFSDLTYSLGSSNFRWKELYVGTSTISNSLSLSYLTSGSVLFADQGGLISQDNSNLFWDNTNKRLGIGTSSPAYTLDINGTLRVSSTSTLTDVLPLQDITYILGSPTLRWANIYAATGTFGSTITIGSYTIQGSATTTLFTGSNTNQLVLGANGNVGIGTTAPGAKLDVQDSGAGPQFDIRSGYGRIKLFPGWNDSWAYLESGNLTWNGNINGLKITGYDVNPLNNLHLLANTIYASGNIGIGTTTPDQALVIDKSGNDVPRLVLNFSSATGHNSGLEFRKDGTFKGGLFIEQGNSNISIWSVNTSNVPIPYLTVQSGTGNVGIGTTAPGIAKLNVANQGTNVGIYVGDVNTQPYGQAMIEINPPGAATHIWAQEGGTRVFSVTPGGTGYFAGNVGIGTTAPSGQLDVSSSFYTRTGEIVLRPQDTTYEGGQITFYGAGSYDTWYHDVWQNAMRFFTNSANTNQVQMYNVGTGSVGLYVQGNVGIGTTTPGAKLHIMSAGESIYFGNGTVSYPTTPSAGLGNLVGRGGTSDFRIAIQDGTGRVNMYWNAYYDASAGAHKYIVSNEGANRLLMTSGDFGFYVAPAGTAGNNISWTNAMYITSSGNVGIGTTAPGTKLHVKSDGSTTIRVDAPSSQQVGYQWAKDGSVKWSAYIDVNSNDLRFWDGTGNRVTFASGGNVGIGTTEPTYKLDVTGGIHSTTGITSDGTFAFIIGTTGFAYLPSNTSHIAYYKKSGTYEYYWRKSDNGYPGGANDSTLAMLNDNGRFYVSGSIGIGTTAPSYKLGVVGTGAATGGWVTGGPDIAENYPTYDLSIEAGDIVAPDPQNPNFIVKTSQSYQNSLIGVISTNPGFIMTGNDDFFTSGKISKDNERLVALAGRVPVKVSTENGEIKVGDLLTSSSKPGVAMKATEPGRVIGIALEPYNGEGIGKIMVFVNPHWFLGQISEEGLIYTEEEIRQKEIQPASILDQFTLAIKKSLEKLGLIIENGIAKVKELIAGKITTKQICLEGDDGETICIDKNQLKQLLEQKQIQGSNSGSSGSGSSGETGGSGGGSETLSPSVNFLYLPYRGTVGSSIAFSATTSNFATDTLIFNWDFGDGATTTTNSPFATHVYNATGTFTLILSVQGGDKSASTSTSVQIEE